MRTHGWLAMICALGLASCSDETIRLTDKDAGRKISLKRGDTFEVTLVANATTGYNWFVEPMKDDVLKQEGEPSYKCDAPHVVGAGGKMTFKFRTIARGETVLKLNYKRPWEKQEPPAKTFEVKVMVK